MPEKCLKCRVHEVQDAYVPTTARYLLQAEEGADEPVLEEGQRVEVRVIDEEEVS